MSRDGHTQRQVDDLQALLEVSRALVATTDLDDLLELITTQAARILDAERATLFLYDPETRVLRSRIAQGVEEIHLPMSKGVAGAVVRSGRVLNVPSAYDDDRFDREIDRQTGFHTRNLLALPLFGYDGELVGVLEILNKRDGQFGDYDESIASGLSAQAGVVLQRARLREHYEEKLRMEKEIEVARQIQADLLPKRNPTVPGFDIVGWNCPCDEVGGDCYDFFDLGDDRLAIGLGDATGHGVGPALVSAEARAALRGLALGTRDLHKIVNLANRLLADDLAAERFVTMFFGVLEGRGARLEYASAGQAPILFFDRERSAVERLEATGMPLGMMGEMDVPVAQPIVFRPGDVLAVLTDGFFEWEREDGEQFGVGRVEHIIGRRSEQPAEKILGAILGALFAFADTPQSDDLTVVIVKRTEGLP